MRVAFLILTKVFSKDVNGKKQNIFFFFKNVLGKNQASFFKKFFFIYLISLYFD